MSFIITDAVRKKEKIRLGLFGPSGSGKTYSSLMVAYGLCGDWSKIVLIDTENRSGVLYSGVDGIGQYKHLAFNPPFHPDRYIEAIKAAETIAEVIIIDSISHEWIGEGGCLELVDRYAEQSKRNDKFSSGWKNVTPMHTRFIDAIRYSTAHIIACGRSKQDYAMVEGSNGKKEVQKLGMGAITRDGFEFEMTASLDINMKHFASCEETGKDRTKIFDGKPPRRLSIEDGKLLAAWGDSGVEKTPEEVEQEKRDELIKEIIQLGKENNLDTLTLKNASGLETLQGASSEELLKSIICIESYISSLKGDVA